MLVATLVGADGPVVLSLVETGIARAPTELIGERVWVLM